MRGKQPQPIPVPALGLIANVPPDQVPTNGMIDGMNVFYDTDGYLKPRFGYQPFLPTSEPSNGPVIGLLWYTDTDGTTVHMCATPTSVFVIVGGVWTNVTGGTPLTGDANDPIAMIDMFFQGAISALISDNSDVIKYWQQGFATILPLTPVYAAVGSGQYVAATNPTFGEYPPNVPQFFFTFQNLNTVPSTSISGIGISGSTVTITVSSAAGFYVGQGITITNVDPSNFDGIFIITNVVGNQISFVVPGASGMYVSGGTVTGGATINLNAIGPVPIRAIINGVLSELPANYLVPGITYNMAFDGVEFLIGTNLTAPVARDIAVISDRVVAVNIEQGNFRSPSLVVWTAAYDPTNWPALAFNGLYDTDDPLIAVKAIGQGACVVYGEESAWLGQSVPGAPDAYAFAFTQIRSVTVGPVSPAVVVLAEGLQYYLARDARIWSCDGNSAQPVSAAIDPLILNDLDPTEWTQTHAVYYPQYRQIWFFYPSRTDNIDGPAKAIIYSLARQAFEPLAIFVEAITASTVHAFTTSTTWNQLTNPWTTYTVPWDSFPVESQLSVLLGFESGDVQTFSSNSPTDNGAQIPYGFTPGLFNIDAITDQLVDSLELFFNPAQNFELLTLAVLGLSFPQDPGYVDFAFPVDLSDPTTYSLPKSLPTINTYRRYYKLIFSGITINRGMRFGGGNIFQNEQARSSQ